MSSLKLEPVNSGLDEKERNLDFGLLEAFVAPSIANAVEKASPVTNLRLGKEKFISCYFLNSVIP